MDRTTLKQVISQQRAAEVKQICNPLFYKSPINGYQFSRLYDDGTRIHLGSDAKWSDVFFSEELYIPAKLIRHPRCYSRNGVYIWDHWPRSCPSYVNCGKIAEDNFDHGHGMTIIHKHETYCDIFDMSVPACCTNSEEFYTSNIDLLEKFNLHFLKQADRLINSAEKNRFTLNYPKSFDPYQEYDDIDIALIDTTNKPLITNSQLYAQLTNREKQILAWLFQGKTTLEIAIILGISNRTTEKFIPRLKTKLNCHSLFQLGAALANLQYRLMLEDFLQA